MCLRGRVSGDCGEGPLGPFRLRRGATRGVTWLRTGTSVEVTGVTSLCAPLCPLIQGPPRVTVTVLRGPRHSYLSLALSPLASWGQGSERQGPRPPAPSSPARGSCRVRTRAAPEPGLGQEAACQDPSRHRGPGPGPSRLWTPGCHSVMTGRCPHSPAPGRNLDSDFGSEKALKRTNPTAKEALQGFALCPAGSPALPAPGPGPKPHTEPNGRLGVRRGQSLDSRERVTRRDGPGAPLTGEHRRDALPGAGCLNPARNVS